MSESLGYRYKTYLWALPQWHTYAFTHFCVFFLQLLCPPSPTGLWSLSFSLKAQIPAVRHKSQALGSNSSLEAQTQALRLKSWPLTSNPDLEAQISAFRLKSSLLGHGDLMPHSSRRSSPSGQNHILALVISSFEATIYGGKPKMCFFYVAVKRYHRRYLAHNL